MVGKATTGFSAADIEAIYNAVITSPSVTAPADASSAKSNLAFEIEWAWTSFTAPETRLTSTTLAKRNKKLLGMIGRQAGELYSLLTTEQPNMRHELTGLFPPLLNIGDPSEYTEALKEGAPNYSALVIGLAQLRDVAKLKAQYADDAQTWAGTSKQNILYLELGYAYRTTFNMNPMLSPDGPFGRFLVAVFQARDIDRDGAAHINEYKRAAKR